MKRNYNFGEKKTEKIDGVELTVFLSPKYESSKEAAIKLLESEAGNSLTEADFWIQKNKSKSGKFIVYSALIITHDALMKVNANLSEGKRFDQNFCSDPIPFDYAGRKGMYMTYRDTRDGMFEIGEITTNSCKNEYPFAMLLKRTFDRVVKRKANLFGIYSDAEDFSTGSDSDEDVNVPGKKPQKVATPSIPKEEDEELTVNPETGEIIESEAPREAPKEDPDVSLTESESADVESALSHELEGLTKRDGKGFMIRRLIESDMLTDEQKLQRLHLFAEKGTEKDKIACSIVAAALEMGCLKFKNSKF